LRNAGLINPESIEDYIAVGGYQALSKVLTSMNPLSVIDEVMAANLRGRGGAGYPTAKKWKIIQNKQADKNILSVMPMKVIRVRI